MWTAFIDVLFTFGGGLIFFDTDKNEYYFIFIFFLSYVIYILRMSGGWLPLLVSRCSDRLRT